MNIGKKNTNIILLVLSITLVILSSYIFYEYKNSLKISGQKINEMIPIFKTSSLYNNVNTLTNNDIKNKTVIINFFASWCIPCKEEHHLILDLNNKFADLTIIGINHKDNIKDAVKFIDDNGNPYDFIGLDYDGNLALKFGVFGLPETYITNSSGKIIYKHLGPLSKEVINKEIIPLL